MTFVAANSREAVRESYAELRDAMVMADVSALAALLDDTFTLTHMTGYRQPKAEWLTDIDTERMQYADIDDVEIAVTVLSDDRAILTARTITEATIWGSRGSWRLQLRFDYEEHDGSWVSTRCVASTW